MNVLELSAICGALLLAAFFAGRLDLDAGGYRDGFGTRAPFPDKAVHAVCAYGLTLTLAMLLPGWMAALATTAAGAAYERGQGFFSMYDLAADVFGALIAWGVLFLFTGVF